MRLFAGLGLLLPPLIDMDTNCKSASITVHDLLAIIDDLTKENQDHWNYMLAFYLFIYFCCVRMLGKMQWHSYPLPIILDGS